MTRVEQEFERRMARIPHHGLGLSVDVYSPDVFELLEALSEARVAWGYLELFKADDRALATVRRHVPFAFLEYHAEGLWITQPSWETSSPADAFSTALRIMLSATATCCS